MSKFSTTQKSNCVLWLAEYGDIKKVQDNFRRKFNEENPGLEIPKEEEVRKWHENFQKYGSFDSKEPRHVEFEVEKVAEITRERKQSTDIHTTIYEQEHGLLNWLGLGKLQQYHPYKMHLKEEPKIEIFGNRLDFAQVRIFDCKSEPTRS